MASRLGKADPTILVGIIRCRQDSIIKIDDDIVGFSEDLPKIDFNAPREVRPTSGSYTRDMVAAAIASPPSDFKGFYIRFVMFVYATGGAITYKSLDNKTYEVTVKWPSASRGGLIDAVQTVHPNFDPYAAKKPRKM